MQIVRLAQWVKASRCLIAGAALAGLLGAPAAVAQGLWQLAPGEADPVVEIERAALAALKAGDSFALNVDGEEAYTAVIDGLHVFPNGDFSWYGHLEETGNQHSLVLTMGGRGLHASLTSPAGVYQLYAPLAEDGWFSGKLRRYSHTRSEAPVEDYSALFEQEGPQDAAGTGPLRLSQRASAERLPVGARWSVDLEVVNGGSTTRENLYAYIYFVLENTALVSAPASCSTEYAEEEPVLRCDLGNLAAGQRKTLNYVVEIGAQSHPLVYSTAVAGAEGEARSDLILEVYRDVAVDSDEDGISDYNERLLGSNPQDGLSTAGEEETVIDLLAVQARGVDELYDGAAATRLHQLISVANRIYQDSEVAIRLRAAGVLKTAYEPAESLAADLGHLTWKTDEALAGVERAREAQGADLVVLLRPMPDGAVEGQSICGLANLGARGLQGDFSAAYQKDFAYSVISIDCLDDSVLAHEIGHNMGLVHSRVEDPEGGTQAHSAGYGIAAQGDFAGFSTVMAYPGDFHTDHKIFRFSNPRQYCGSGGIGNAFQCGRDVGDAERGADAVSTLNLVRHQIGAWYPALEERLANLRAVGAEDASMRGGASADGGLTYATAFPADSRVDFRAIIEPAPEHVGRLATRHAVFKLGSKGFFQFDQDGELRSWTLKDFARLEPLGPPAPLPERLVLEGLQGFSALERGLSGERVSVFFAYRLVADGRLVYSASPVSVLFTAPAADDATMAIPGL